MTPSVGTVAPPKVVTVWNLPADVHETDIKELCAQFGEVTACELLATGQQVIITATTLCCLHKKTTAEASKKFVSSIFFSVFQALIELATAESARRLVVAAEGGLLRIRDFSVQAQIASDGWAAQLHKLQKRVRFCDLEK